MNAPKPGSWIKPNNGQPEDHKPKQSTKNPKKPFVRQDHLTQKPFKGNTELTDLKRRLSSPRFKNR